MGNNNNDKEVHEARNTQEKYKKIIINMFPQLTKNNASASTGSP